MKTLYLSAITAVLMVRVAAGQILYTTDGGYLSTVNQATGSGVNNLLSCGCNRSENDITSRPGVSGFLYGVSENSPSPGSVLDRISISSGHRDFFPSFSRGGSRISATGRGRYCYFSTKS